MSALNSVFNEVVIALPALGDLVGKIRDDWLGPIYILAVGFLAFVFLKDRSWMKLIGFVGIAAIVGILIFASESLVGQNGSLSKTGEEYAKTIK